MYTKTNEERPSIGSKTSDTMDMDADLSATIAMMKSCSVSESTTAPESKATHHISTTVDTPTTSMAHPSEKMEIDTSILERSAVHKSNRAPRPQHKRLARLAGGDARFRAISLHKTLAPLIHRGRAQPVQRPSSGLRSAAGKRDPLEIAAMQVLEATGGFACDGVGQADLEAGEES
jgi:hypothetical protein